MVNIIEDYKTATANQPGTYVNATVFSAVNLVDPNPNRLGVWVSNPDSRATVWLSLGGEASVPSGIAVPPRSTWFTDLYTGAISAYISYPLVGIADITPNGGNLATITFNQPHNLNLCDEFQIAGNSKNFFNRNYASGLIQSINDDFTITIFNPREYIAAISVSANVARVTINEYNNLESGDAIFVEGTGHAELDGNQGIIAKLYPDVFTYGTALGDTNLGAGGWVYEETGGSGGALFVQTLMPIGVTEL